MTQKLKVVIDKAACCGYGVCAEICPQVYKLDDNGMGDLGMLCAGLLKNWLAKVRKPARKPLWKSSTPEPLLFDY